MKLTGIAIDGYRKLTNIRLTQLTPSINLIYGEKGTGKTRIADFITGVLFGHGSSGLPDQGIGGTLEIEHAAANYSLTRNSRGGDQLSITPLSPADHGTSVSLSQIANGLDPGLFENFYNVSFDTRQTSRSSHPGHPLADALHRRMGVPIGSDAAIETTASPLQLQTAANLRQEIETTNSTFASLQRRSQQLASQIAANTANAAAVILRAREMDQQIADIELRIANLTVNPHATELDQIAAEIEQLQRTIDTARPTYVAAPLPAIDNTSLLYEQIDEVDLQLVRWKSVQNDVQQQRVVLKDEMLRWNQLTLESEQHPYHNARKILLNLERRVDHAQSQTTQWLDSHGPLDSHQAAGFVNDVCKGMRGDLYDLCDELGKQYQQIRHRSAAAELKRLRRCYEEITENVNRLFQRRLAIVDQIRLRDPAGADAILKADDDFCQCAAHDGHRKARERFIGPITPSPPATQLVAPDLTNQRSRIAVLETRRAELQGHRSNNSLEMTQLQSQLTNLRNQRAQLLPPDEGPLKIDLATVEGELQRCTLQLQSLKNQLAQSSTVVPVPPHKLLVDAAAYLTRLSHGELARVWVSNDTQALQLQVQDRHQRVLRMSALTPTMRSQTELSLILAANDSLAATGITSPLIIDELFENFDSDRIDTALQCLAEFAQRGHQVIMLTQHRFLIDRANNFGAVGFFDLQSQIPSTTPAYAATANLSRPPMVAINPGLPTASPPVSPTLTAVHSTISSAAVPVAAPTAFPTIDITAAPGPATIAFPSTRNFSTNGTSTNGTTHAVANFAAPNAPQMVASIKANQIGDRLEYAVTFESHSPLSDVPIFDSIQLRTFHDQGILSIDDLLSVDIDRLPAHWAEAGLTASIVDNMQSEVWLLTCVPALRPYDAHVLVACGICEPDQLETSAAQNLLERVQRYLNANEAEHEFDDTYRITIGRINDWHRGIAKTRNRWRNGRRRDRNSSARSFNRSPDDDGDFYDDRQSSVNRQSYTNGQSYDHRPAYNRGPSDHNGRGRDRQRSQDDDSTATRSSRSNGPRISRYRSQSRPRDNGTGYRDNDYRDNDRINDRTNDRSSRDQAPFQDRRDRRYDDRPANRSADRQSSGRTEKIVRTDNATPRPNDDREPANNSVPRSPRMNTPTPDTVRRSVPAIEPESQRTKDVKPAATRSSPQPTKSTHKFYLDLEDHIEAAPSIGPKTAERFEKIGVFTIGEFLKQTADSMATKLNYKRMSADVVRSWQQQARLVCRIPNLRGHDAQLLVACEIFEPEEIASMQPQALFRIIGPFSETKEGLKIIRSGKQPDLAEITDWVAWAQHTRSLQAA